MTNQFNNYIKDEKLLNNLISLKYNEMTPIQASSLPVILEQKDIIAKAKTGSGKTVSFGLGILNNLKDEFKIQALVLTPTRELAFQVGQSLRELARYRHNIKILNLTGGLPYHPQVHSLKHKAHILVATPGRLLKHLKEQNFSPADIHTLVLDEADRMLDMGFGEDIKAIIDYLPKNRHTMLFSATYPNDIESLSQDIMNNPARVEVESSHSSKSINQVFIKIENNSLKQSTTIDILKKYATKKNPTVLIFCNTKIACDELADYLSDTIELESLVLHSDMDQKDRDETLILFANKSYPVLIATDVASRGLDIDDIDLVINYDLPRDNEVYVHRIGRTARAGKDGLAVSLISDIRAFEDLQEDLSDSLSDEFELQDIKSLKTDTNLNLSYEYSTIYIGGGKRHKLRAGDILGALTSGIGLHKNDIGKINILPTCSYVAIKNSSYKKALDGLFNSKIKNKFFKVYKR